MRCRTASNLISPYVSAELSPHDAARLEAHLSECDRCFAELAAAERSMQALRRPVTQADPPDVLAQVKIQALLDRRRIFVFPRWASAALAGAAACLAGLMCVAPLGPRTSMTPPSREEASLAAPRGIQTPVVRASGRDGATAIKHVANRPLTRATARPDRVRAACGADRPVRRVQRKPRSSVDAAATHIYYVAETLEAEPPEAERAPRETVASPPTETAAAPVDQVKVCLCESVPVPGGGTERRVRSVMLPADTP